MSLGVLYYDPWWRRKKYIGPWVVVSRLPKGWAFYSYFRHLGAALFHLSVTWGFTDYD